MLEEMENIKNYLTRVDSNTPEVYAKIAKNT